MVTNLYSAWSFNGEMKVDRVEDVAETAVVEHKVFREGDVDVGGAGTGGRSSTGLLGCLTT